ncbi:MAG: hypothetical protein AAF391_02745, partial [Bacteroidota bacterium]
DLQLELRQEFMSVIFTAVIFFLSHRNVLNVFEVLTPVLNLVLVRVTAGFDMVASEFITGRGLRCLSPSQALQHILQVTDLQPCRLPFPMVELYAFPSCRLLFGLLGYFGIGFAFMYARRGARGREAIPNYQFWIGLPGLIKVGRALSFAIREATLACDVKCIFLCLSDPVSRVVLDTTTPIYASNNFAKTVSNL